LIDKKKVHSGIKNTLMGVLKGQEQIYPFKVEMWADDTFDHHTHTPPPPKGKRIEKLKFF
jgi:hypothetical protein